MLLFDGGLSGERVAPTLFLPPAAGVRAPWYTLNYRFVMQAIADLGFTGFVSHEYSPSQGHDPIKELEKAIALCDV